jgi:hypothetical protein
MVKDKTGHIQARPMPPELKRFTSTAIQTEHRFMNDVSFNYDY